MSGFPYRPLLRGKKEGFGEFRLLRLMDVEAHTNLTRDAILRCELFVTRLDHYETYVDGPRKYRMNKVGNFLSRTLGRDRTFSGDFFALSYVWGNPKLICDIEINGGRCKIGANLHAALRSIQANTPFRVLWCDALCINQKDDAEKSWQVQQMGTIYTLARATISYLGPSSQDSGRAMMALTRLGRKCNSLKYGEIAHALEGDLSHRRYRRNLLHGILSKRYQTPSVQHLCNKFRRHFQACLDPALWNAIAKICTRPYWSRSWIFQEMASSRERYFLCGDFLGVHIDKALALLLAWTRENTATDREPIHQHCVAMVSALQSLQIHKKEVDAKFRYLRMGTLLEMLQKLSLLEASDPRDTIYAPLAIATDRERLAVKPDYSKNLSLLLNETACALLRQGHPEVLLYASLQNQNSYLPSWVPDWSSNLSVDLISSLSVYHADKNRVQRKDLFAAIPPIASRIVLDCYFVGKISSISHPCPASALDQQESTLQNPLFADWLHHAEACVFPPGEEALGSSISGNRRRYPQHAIAELLLTPGKELQRLPWLLHTNPYALFYSALKSATSLRQLSSQLETGASNEESKYMASQTARVYNTLKSGSRVFRTDTGYVGLTWQDKDKMGDIVAIIPGVRMPCVLRAIVTSEKSGVAQQPLPHFKLAGVNYVYKIMDGEFFRQEETPECRAIALC